MENTILILLVSAVGAWVGVAVSKHPGFSYMLGMLVMYVCSFL